MDKKTMDKFKEFDDLFTSISQKLKFSKINPSNVLQVRREFLKKIHNPEFKYEPLESNLLNDKRKLLNLEIPKNTNVGKVFHAKRIELIQKIDLINTIGMPHFTKQSIKIYGEPNKRLVNKAYKILKELKDVSSDERIKTEFVVKILKENFKKNGLDWQLKKIDMTSSANVVQEESTLFLRKKKRFQKNYVNRLIIHEIGTHVLRAENGLRQPFKIFFYGLPGYLSTEEGLAIFNEERVGLLRNAYLRDYAGRVIATKKAIKNSFLEVYNELRGFFSREKAFALAMRAKRGIPDSSEAGGYTKDYVYLKGYYKVKKYIEKGGKLNDLFLGKVPLELVEVVKSWGFIKEAKYKPDNLVFVE